MKRRFNRGVRPTGAALEKLLRFTRPFESGFPLSRDGPLRAIGHRPEFSSITRQRRAKKDLAMKLPWVKWFPADWFSDPEIRRLPLIAKGLWHEALMAMMLSDAFELTGTPQELSRVIGCSISDFNEAFRHLLRYRACDCHAAPDGSVTLMSRRLKRLANSRQAAALRKHKQRSHAPCHAEVPSASASASVIEGIGVQRKKVTFWSVVSQKWLPK